MFIRNLIIVLLLGYYGIGCKSSFNQKHLPALDGTTSFQTASPWEPETDVPADIAMIYGTHDVGNITFEERVKSWKEKGFITHFMTGISWGAYQDYFDGSWDGEKHEDEGQVSQNGETIWHHGNVPYVVPTDNYLNLSETYPDIMQYLYETKSENDFFAADASCAGYINPNLDEPEPKRKKIVFLWYETSMNMFFTQVHDNSEFHTTLM